MKLTKAFAVLVAASAALGILSATPASATVHNVAVTGGTLSTTTLGNIAVGPGGTPTPPCTNYATDTDVITIDATTTSTSVVVTAVSITSSLMAGTPTAPYAVLITKHTGSNAGTVNSTTPFAYTQALSLRVEFYTVTLNTTTPPGVCTSGAKVCTVAMTFTGLTGTATAHPFAASTTAALSGTGTVTAIFAQTCNAPFATLIGTTVTLTNLTLHVITAPYTLAVTGGTLSTTTLGNIAVGPGGTPTPPCTNYATDTDVITIEATAASTSVVVTTVTITSSLMAGTPTAPYAVLITKHTGSNTGTVNSTTPFAYTQALSLRVEFYTATLNTTTPPGVCTSGTKVCTVAMTFAALTGNASAHPFAVTPATTATLGGTGTATGIFAQTCNAPFSTLVSTAVTLTSLTLLVISSP